MASVGMIDIEINPIIGDDFEEQIRAQVRQIVRDEIFELLGIDLGIDAIDDNPLSILDVFNARLKECVPKPIGFPIVSKDDE